VKRLCAVLVAGILLLTGCGSNSTDSSGSTSAGAPSSTGSGPTGSITVLAAASLTEAFGTITKSFQAKYPGARVTVSYGASSDLSTQIQQGKPGKIIRLADLARSGVKVGVCDAAVPCGAVAKTVFANAKLTVKPVANLKDVKSTLAVVESGEVDAGLVYVTDVRAAGSKVKGIEIPADVNASTTYPIATLKSTQNATLAKAFVAYVLSPAGQQVLTADGFSKP
jgi:molybdate transport system substrate-binding protein